MWLVEGLEGRVVEEGRGGGTRTVFIMAWHVGGMARGRDKGM
jgi:hypothetical protein